jgi:WD40 repeat protein
MREVGRFDTGVEAATHFALSRDGKIAVTAGDGMSNQIRVLDIDKKKQIAIFKPKSLFQSQVVVSPDKQWLACWGMDAEQIEFRALKTGALVRMLKPEGQRVAKLDLIAFSPKSDLIVAADLNQGEVIGWECSSGRQTLSLKTGVLGGVAFLPDGRLVTAGKNDKTMKIWDLASRAALKTIPLEEDIVTRLVVSPDGKFAAIMAWGATEERRANGSTVFVWDLQSGKKVSQFQHREVHFSFNPMSYLADNNTLVISSSRYLGFWDGKTGKNIRDAERASRRFLPNILGQAVADDGTLYLMRSSGALQMYQVTY